MKKTQKAIMILVLLMIVIAISVYLSSLSENSTQLSDKEKIEDYEYLWSVIEESYPFWGVVERRGIDKDSIYIQGKKDVVSFFNKSDSEFSNSIRETIMEFNGIGHLSVVGPQFYKELKTFYTEESALKNGRIEWYKTLYNDTSRDYYGKFNDDSNTFELVDQSKVSFGLKSINAIAKEDNVSIEFNDEKNYIYIGIKSFASKNINNDREKIANAIKVTSEYDNLIIDIRDNSGGSDYYWRELIVSPMISEKISLNRISLYRSSRINDKFLIEGSEKYFHDINELENLPKLDVSDRNSMSHYFMIETSLEPKVQNKGYTGNIYVLVNKRVYSSSESFVMFCKDTGFASIVGNGTSGGGGTYDPIVFSLPNSGLIIRFSMLSGLNGDGSCNEEVGTEPDFMVDDADELEECLKLISMN